MNLDDLTLPELKKLQKDVTKAIDNFADREKKALLAELEALARDRGYPLAQLLGDLPTKTRAPVAPKYAHPSDPSQTWSGRGRKPAWVVEALAQGKSMADLAI
jgi:DNA-binding protein H-NS